MKRLLDSSFRYVHSTQTDIRKTFERVRREQKLNDAERSQKITRIQPKERKHG